MTVTDRAVWLLNHFGIELTQIEYLALRLTDGMYEEANKTLENCGNKQEKTIQSIRKHA